MSLNGSNVDECIANWFRNEVFSLLSPARLQVQKMKSEKTCTFAMHMLPFVSSTSRWFFQRTVCQAFARQFLFVSQDNWFVTLSTSNDVPNQNAKTFICVGRGAVLSSTCARFNTSARLKRCPHTQSRANRHHVAKLIGNPLKKTPSGACRPSLSDRISARACVFPLRQNYSHPCKQ